MDEEAVLDVNVVGMVVVDGKAISIVVVVVMVEVDEEAVVDVNVVGMVVVDVEAVKVVVVGVLVEGDEDVVGCGFRFGWDGGRECRICFSCCC